MFRWLILQKFQVTLIILAIFMISSINWSRKTHESSLNIGHENLLKESWEDWMIENRKGNIR